MIISTTMTQAGWTM